MLPCHRATMLRYYFILPAFGIFLLASGCKPRNAASGTLAEESKTNFDKAAALEASKVRAACEGKSGTFYRGVNQQGVSVEYTVTDEPVVDAAKSRQLPWYESAQLKEGKWALSVPISGNKKGLECLQAVTHMVTAQFIAALGCNSDNPCKPSADLCTSGTCLATLTQADFSVSTLSGLQGKADSSAIALAGKGATCAQTGGEWQLKGPGGKSIGKPVDTEASCQALAGTAKDSVACGWTGSAFLPMRLTDGMSIGGGPQIGTKSLKQCAALTATAKNGVACSLSKDGFAPYAVSGNIHAIGDSQMGPDADDCAERILVVEAGKTCSWGKAGIQVYNVASAEADAQLGSFTSYALCHDVVKKVKDASGRTAYLATLKKVSATKLGPVITDESKGTQKDSLGLAGGGGWTWGECNDTPAKGYHLSRLDAYGRLVCAGKFDALYSWGPWAKVIWLSQQRWDTTLFRDDKPNPIFLTQSSFATFGYGAYGIRFKIKKGVNWKYIQNQTTPAACAALTLAEQQNTVLAAWWDNGERTGFEFGLCSLGPVHSWSYGTQGHIDEMVRETNWINTHNFKFYELYVKKNGVDDILPNGLDGHLFTQDILNAQLAAHVALLPGQIYYNPNAYGQTPAYHFQSEYSNYINP